MAQALLKSCWPYVPPTFFKWQLAQSPLKTACRSTFAAAMPAAFCSSVILTTTGGRILTRSMRSFLPLSVVTATVLIIVPDLPARLMLSLISPLVPGGIVQGVGGSSAVVQPQDGCTFKIVTLHGVKLVTAVISVAVAVTLVIRVMSATVAMLVKLKVNFAKSWSAAASTIFIVASHAMTPSGNGSPACE